MLTLKGELFKDVTAADFSHYFAGTAMAWKIGLHKRRLFLVGNFDAEAKIAGTYLTRENAFKDKKIPFKGWWEFLDPIVMQPIFFNTSNGCGVWKHPLQKNLKKSFPWQANCLKFYGKVTPNEKTLQHVASLAFSELYGNPRVFPSIKDAWYTEVNAAYTKENFMFCRSSGQIFYRARNIGYIVEGKIALSESRYMFRDLLLKAGIKPEDIVVKEQAAKDKDKAKEDGHMKDNPFYVQGYHPQYWGDAPSYSVSCLIKDSIEYGGFRTYRGNFPGNGSMVKGWTLHNYWNQFQ